MKNQNLIKSFLIGVIILFVGVGSVLGFRYAKQAKKDQDLATPLTKQAGKVKGPDSAPIRILYFSDFQCPACRTAVTILESLAEKYPGKIQLVFKHFPLRMHVWSPAAHQSAECAAEQGKFWDYYKKIYENQPTWAALPDPMVSFATYATEVGLNMSDFTQCMTSSVVAEHIASEKKEGEVLEVKSTPTFFINGKMFAGPMDLQIGGEEFIRKTLSLPPEPKKEVAPAAAVAPIAGGSEKPKAA